MSLIKITTQRLILKQIDETYADKVLQFYTENNDFLSKWEPARSESFFSADYHSNILKSELEKCNSGRMMKFWIFETDNPDKVIGSIALNEIVRGCFLSCFLGYKMAESCANKGYMTEAVSRLVKYAFNSMKLHRIEANIIPRNHASIKVVEKCGFENEGLSKKYLRINGVWEDHIHMVILNESME